MQFHVYSKGVEKWEGIKFYFLFFAFLISAHSSLAQTVSLSLKQEPIEKAFTIIEVQTKFRFVYSKETLRNAGPVTIQLKKVSLREALTGLFAGQPLTYSIEDNYIMVRAKEPKSIGDVVEVKGRVSDVEANPLQGVSIRVMGTDKGTVTNESGDYSLQGLAENSVLEFSFIGMETIRIPVKGRDYISVSLKTISKTLDETIIQAYGTTTRRLSTGNIGKVSAQEIARQPVSNVLAALEGQVPGLDVVQSSGMPGSAFRIQIRGQGSLLQGSDPLILIDGIPFSPGNGRLNQINAAAALSPLNLLNIADIESIEILKDADATAIYGSRGANGVVLITTKKGDTVATRVGASMSVGYSTVTRTMSMLNTPQYLRMRHEAFTNDGKVPNADDPLFGAPDLLTWDTTRYTDFKKLLLGNRAQFQDAQLHISGGTKNTQFLLSSAFHRETTVSSANLSDQKASFHATLNHNSNNRLFSVNLSATYVTDKNNMVATDPANFINLPPMIHLYDSTGKLNWKEGSYTFSSLGLSNPLAFMNRKYQGLYDNLLSSFQLGLQPLKSVKLKVNIGYNLVVGSENQINPGTSIDPARNELPYAYFSNSSGKSLIVEPQAEFFGKIKNVKLTALIGGSWQQNASRQTIVNARNYSSDLLLESISAAGNVMTSNDYNQYKYIAAFGRINYNLNDKYLMNISGRRDGSSRFGPANQFVNYGAAGMGWIFSNEKFISNNLEGISFGKLRVSYGVTGNDQIGDYQFIDTWNTSSQTYQATPTLVPNRLYNPDYSWEKNVKLETALDLGLVHNKILISLSYYLNRSNNQLVSYSLPIQTGFGSVMKNLDAEIHNKGFEFVLQTKNVSQKSFTWTSQFSLTINRNKLIRFPGLETSTYANRYIIGQPLSVTSLYQYLGVNPKTGVYEFTDVDSNGSYNSKDKIVLRNTDPRYYGGFQNSVSYKGWQLDLFFQFRKQLGRNYLYTQGAYVPGYRYLNHPVIVLDRWEKTGDVTNVQKFTSSPTSAAYNAASSQLINSSAVYSDASFVRLKNISLSYDIDISKVKRNERAGQSLRFFFDAQNVLTWTRYVGSDPEVQNLYVMPPLKTFRLGMEVSL